VKRTTVLICCAVLLMGAQSALAQYHGGGGGGHRHGGGDLSGPTTPDTRNNDIKGFERAVALQASPDQIAQFRRLSASTQAARQRTREVLSGFPSAKPRNGETLANALQEAGWENEKFLDSFSKEQELGLKKFAKKIRKTDSELDHHSKALQALDFSATSDSEIVASLQKLNKALGDLQSQQLAIAAEMGIQNSATQSQ